MYEMYAYIACAVIAIIILIILVVRQESTTNKVIDELEPNTDAFGRVRISNPYTLGDYKHIYSANPDMITNLTSGGTVTHQTNEASNRLAVTTTKGSKAIHQSKMYHQYMPGKSQNILSSFVFFEATKGITKRTGYYDDRDGMFFQQDGDGTLSFVVRSYVTGTTVDTKVEQKDWNGDKINGSGKSKWNIDITKTQLVWFDFQWLGVGRVRCGFVHKDDFVTCHTFYHSDILDKVYLNNPNLPIRCEIENVEGGNAGYFDQICSTVLSEGGYSEAGIDGSVISTRTNLITTNQTNFFAIRLKNTFLNSPNRAFARLLKVEVLTEDQPVSYDIVKVSTIDGTYTSSNGSIIEYSTNGPTNPTNVEVIDSGLVLAGSQGNKSFGTISTARPSDAKKNYISQNFDSTDSEAYLVRITPLAQPTNVTVVMSWREIY